MSIQKILNKINLDSTSSRHIYKGLKTGNYKLQMLTTPPEVCKEIPHICVGISTSEQLFPGNHLGFSSKLVIWYQCILSTNYKYGFHHLTHFMMGSNCVIKVNWSISRGLSCRNYGNYYLISPVSHIVTNTVVGIVSTFFILTL